MSPEHQLGELQVQAKEFASCFEPNGYQLDAQFDFLDDQQRRVLGERAEQALEEAYIETIADIHQGDL